MTTSIDDGNLTIFDLVMLARNITLTLTRNSLTAATLSWVPPTDYNVYGGCVIILSTAPIDSSNYPIDGVKYNASQDVSFPSSVIGSAQVVYASYAQNGQDLKLSTISLYNLDPAKQYYASLHLCSPTLQYHTAGIQSYLLESTSGGTSNKPWDATGVVPKSSTAPVNPSIGQVYFDLAQMHVYMWSGTAWVQTSLDGVITGSSFPSSPKTGAFFYNLQNKILYGFDGANWNVVPLEQNGTPLYSKLGIGTDGSLDEREALIQQLKLMLGWPSVCIELDATAFDLAIDNAIAEFRRYADNAYQTRYVALQLFRSQSNYYLNDPQVGSDRIVNIMKIHRVNTLGLASFGGPNGVYAQTFLNQFSAGGTVDILSIHLMASMSEEFERIFAGNIMFSFDENSRELNIYRTLYGDERVLLECSMERTEQELMKDRYIKQWLKKWAKAELQHMLGMIRTKYSNGLPSANGGLSLNGDTLLSESQADFEECRRQIKDYEVGNGGVSIGAAPFMF